MSAVADAYARLIDRIAAWASSRDDVRAAIVLGSRARTDVPADDYSDLDLVLVVDDPAPFLADAGWLAARLLGFAYPAASERYVREWLAANVPESPPVRPDVGPDRAPR